MGVTLLDIKLKTQNDYIRTCVADLESVGDASALEKRYHRKCLRYAERICYPVDLNNTTLFDSMCDEQLVSSLKNTLTEDVTLNMAQVNDEYLSILKRYQVEINETANYRKHLKKLIIEQIPNVQFIKSLCKNKPENLVLPTVVSKAMDLRSLLLENEDTIGMLKNVANILRGEIMQHRNWSFNGTFEDFQNPPLLQFFLTHLLFGHQVLKVSGIRNEEVDKTVDIACQFLVQNTRSDRQVKHQSKKNCGFQQTVQTPLSIGLPLAIHSRVRDKNLVNNLSEVYIGSDYQRILDFEKRLEQGVLQRMMETSGFCLPDFVQKNVNIWFAVDNIDLLEDTPTGQNTFHGTVIVINQQAADGDPINQALVLPEKLPSAPLTFEVKYLPEPIIKTEQMRFEVYELGKRKHLISNNFTHTLALADYFATSEVGSENSSNYHMETEQQLEVEMQHGQTEGENPDIFTR